MTGDHAGWGTVGRDDAARVRYLRAKEVFCRAIELDEGDRAAFLRSACAGDEDLRGDVESLLASDRLADAFIETPAAALIGAPRTGEPPPPERECEPLPRGTRLGAYEIEEFIGSGGMGEVYRARDSTLQRTVAIKVACGDRGDRRSHARLLREARHASGLNHPHICTIHEVGADDRGYPFIVMEHLAGETLRDAVRRSGRLPPALVLRHGANLAAALDHAHGRGVIHRDLKSANVMVAEGGVKVLDFGLARTLPESSLPVTASLATDTLALAGTVDYMAPEVLRGRAADARSDLWSLGIVLFEMAAGYLPFRGQTPFQTASAILAADLPRFPRGVPLGLRLVIRRCLSGDPAARYRSAAEVRAALVALQGRGRRRIMLRMALAKPRPAIAARASILVAALVVLASTAWWLRQAGRTATPARTVAVMPLADAAGGEAERYFADGLTEALISEIGETGVRRVISGTTAMRFRDRDRSVTDVARQLGVDVVLEGSVGRFADRVQLSVRLLAAETGRVLWAATRRRPTPEVLALVSQLAAEVASAMRHSMTEDERIRRSTVRTVEPAVYEAYLKGRYHWNERTEPSLQRAVEFYQEAIRLDATYAPAHAALADCYNQLGTVMVGTGSPAQYRPLAAASTTRALQIDPNLAAAHATLGYIDHYEWKWEEAEREFLRAIRLNPSNSLAHIWYANLLASRRRFSEAVREVQVGRDLDPFSLVVNTNVGWTLEYAGLHQEAADALRRALELDPSYVQAHLRLLAVLQATGRLDDAVREAQAVVRLTGENPSSLASLAAVYARAGRKTQAREVLARLMAESGRRYVSPASISSIYEQLGDMDATFEWLEKAYREHSNYIAYLAADSHAPLRSDPRFASLLQRVGLEHVR